MTQHVADVAVQPARTASDALHTRRQFERDVALCDTGGGACLIHEIERRVGQDCDFANANDRISVEYRQQAGDANPLTVG